MKTESDQSIKSKIKWIAILAIVVCIAKVMSSFLFQIMLIQGSSMEPTYHNFQPVILDKHFTPNQITQGDVISFQSKNLNSVLVKRVVALPGQRVSITDGILFVDGEPSDLYIDIIFEYSGLLQSELILGEEELFVIGDNVSESKDSRFTEVGTVSFDDVIGIVID